MRNIKAPIATGTYVESGAPGSSTESRGLELLWNTYTFLPAGYLCTIPSTRSRSLLP